MAGMLLIVWVTKSRRVGCCVCIAVLGRLVAVFRLPVGVLLAVVVGVRLLILSGQPWRLVGVPGGGCGGIALPMA